MEEKQTVGAAKRTVQRSPNYPAITLEKAIERARVFWNHEKRNPANITVALRHWGYGPNSGGGRTLVGALVGFGVVRDEGAGDKRQLRLSETAIRVLLDERPLSTEREAAIRELALTPKIYRDILARWPHLDVSDDNLRYYLLAERKFNDNAVGEFIRDFRATMAFAKLPSSHEEAQEIPPTVDTPTVQVGDYVRWESNGVVQFDSKRVAWVNDGYAGVDGSSTGLPLAELEVVSAPPPSGMTGGSVPTPQPLKSAHPALFAGIAQQKGGGMRQEVFALAEGDVTIQWPERLSPESLEDFTDWLRILERKVRRAAVTELKKPSESLGDPE